MTRSRLKLPGFWRGGNSLKLCSQLATYAPAGGYVGQWLQSFKEFPPRQKPGSFNLDRVMEAVTKGAGDK